MFFELRVERQGPQDGCNLEIGLIFPDNDDISQKKLGLEASISSQDDPLFPMGNLNETMQILPMEDSSIEAEGSQPLGQFSEGGINDESLFHPMERPVSRDRTRPAWRPP